MYRFFYMVAIFGLFSVGFDAKTQEPPRPEKERGDSGDAGTHQTKEDLRNDQLLMALKESFEALRSAAIAKDKERFNAKLVDKLRAHKWLIDVFSKTFGEAKIIACTLTNGKATVRVSDAKDPFSESYAECDMEFISRGKEWVLSDWKVDTSTAKKKTP